MTNPEDNKDPSMEDLLKKYDSLEKRIALIESRLASPDHIAQETGLSGFGLKRNTGEQEPDLDLQIGSHGLAWLGNFVLVVGIVFLMNYFQNSGKPILAASLGYLVSGLLFYLAYKFSRSLSHIVFVLNISGIVLSYYTTLKLHFFTADPLIGQVWVGVSLVLVMIGLLTWFALRTDSEFFGGLSVVLIILTSVLAGRTHISLPLLVLASALSASMFLIKSWKVSLLVSIFLVYLTHLVWLLGNPFLGNPLRIVTSHQHNVYYLFLYAAFYALVILKKDQDSVPGRFHFTVVMWNSVLFFFLSLLVVLAFYETNYTGIYSAMAVICLGMSVLLHSRKASHGIPSWYATFGFMALSVSIFGYAGLPNGHLLLAVQSLLVISIALWYRSRVIVVVNSLLFLGILLIYLIAYPHAKSIDVAFAVAALASSRILYWQKERLSLRTEGMRNLYLAEGFVMVLYSLHQIVAANYVSLSWTLAASIYLVLSIVLRDVKYRWMAFATFLAAAVYLFLVDLANLQIGYKILAFLVLALISIAASIYYTRKAKGNSTHEDPGVE